MNAEERGFKHKEITEKVIGAFFAVYNELGHGFLESVYENALSIALEDTELNVVRQQPIPVWFRGRQVGDFRADLVVESVLVVEIKASRSLEPSHEAQLLNYLKGTKLEVGLLLNFGPRPIFKRMAFDNERKQIGVHPRLSAVKSL